MKYLFVLAFKNLTRYKRRTLITAGAIAFGLSMFIFMDSLMVGAISSSKNNLIDYETGSAQIYAPGYEAEHLQLSTKYLIEKPRELMMRLEEVGVENVSPRLTISAELINEENGHSQRAIVSGIDPELDEKVYKFSSTIRAGNEVTKKRVKAINKELAADEQVDYIQGRYLKRGEEGVVLGGWLAEELDLFPGDYITLNFNMRPFYDAEEDEWLSGSFSSVEVEVLGLLKTGNPIANRSFVMMDLDYLDELIVAEGGVSTLVIRYPETIKGERLFNKAVVVICDYFDIPTSEYKKRGIIKTWRDLGASFLAVAAADQGSTVLILVLIALIAGVGISNTMMMSVMERKREIGMMRAMGMTHGSILLNFVIEAAGVGVIGVIGGVILGVLLNLWIIYRGINFGFLMRDFDVGYRIADVFKGGWNIPMIIVGSIFTILITALFAVFPAMRSLKQEIPETLRVE